MKYLLIILSLILMPSNAYSQNAQITSFSKSKKLLLKTYKDNPYTSNVVVPSRVREIGTTKTEE